MNKKQYQAITKNIEANISVNYELRLNLIDGTFKQGIPKLLEPDVIIVNQPLHNPIYVDLASVVSIEVG